MQDIEKIPTKWVYQIFTELTIILRLCLVCTVKTQTVNEFQEFASKKLNVSRWEKSFSKSYYILICVVIQSVFGERNKFYSIKHLSLFLSVDDIILARKKTYKYD